ncbi:hypothetical protein [Microbacterium binotii]|jgi:hypothetical protein|uniref:Uncharacterized protein n=1 Tax=Microbacterium binotii TaxID=462710 RepID=A0ABN3PIX0_9MICO|nr:hypothetical protein [Microbacterium binotii]UIN31726.1 hypothetical protein LXM64_05935 [Microbacterium binotii]
MHLAVWLAEVTPTPTPTDVDPLLVTPGPWGFAVIALVGVAVILLVWDMLRRIRRGRYRSEVREQLDAEELAAKQGDAAERDSETDDEDIDPAQR